MDFFKDNNYLLNSKKNLENYKNIPNKDFNCSFSDEIYSSLILNDLTKMAEILSKHMFCNSFALTALILNDNKNILTDNVYKILYNSEWSSDLTKEILDVINIFFLFLNKNIYILINIKS